MTFMSARDPEDRLIRARIVSGLDALAVAHDRGGPVVGSLRVAKSQPRKSIVEVDKRDCHVAVGLSYDSICAAVSQLCKPSEPTEAKPPIVCRHKLDDP